MLRPGFLPILAAQLILAAAALCAGEPPSIRLELERWESNTWTPVDPKLVFAQNDRLRFRITSSNDGYLYVWNQGSDGKLDRMIPQGGPKSVLHVEGGKPMLIPGKGNYFTIDGPPGFDVTYWVMSPKPMTNQPKERVTPEEPSSLLIPRCRETPLQARGPCLDDRAGAASAKPPAEGLRSRSLKIEQEGSGLRITTPPRVSEQESEAVYYVFRVAHR